LITSAGTLIAAAFFPFAFPVSVAASGADDDKSGLGTGYGSGGDDCARARPAAANELQRTARNANAARKANFEETPDAFGVGLATARVPRNPKIGSDTFDIRLPPSAHAHEVHQPVGATLRNPNARERGGVPQIVVESRCSGSEQEMRQAGTVRKINYLAYTDAVRL
jgi:hypothetical protein